LLGTGRFRGCRATRSYVHNRSSRPGYSRRPKAKEGTRAFGRLGWLPEGGAPYIRYGTRAEFLRGPFGVWAESGFSVQRTVVARSIGRRGIFAAVPLANSTNQLGATGGCCTSPPHKSTPPAMPIPPLNTNTRQIPPRSLYVRYGTRYGAERLRTCPYGARAASVRCLVRSPVRTSGPYRTYGAPPSADCWLRLSPCRCLTGFALGIGSWG
jgi:hypothetical protein